MSEIAVRSSEWSLQGPRSVSLKAYLNSPAAIPECSHLAVVQTKGRQTARDEVIVYTIAVDILGDQDLSPSL